MQTLSVNSILKPRKSSLKPSKRLPEVPELCVTMEDDTSPACNGSGSQKDLRDDVCELSDGLRIASTAGEVIALNGIANPVTSEADEKRRPSTVTFNETTQIIEIIGRKRK